MEFDPGTDPASAASLAKSSQVAIVFAVQHESESIDLQNLSLPDKQDELIEAWLLRIRTRLSCWRREALC